MNPLLTLFIKIDLPLRRTLLLTALLGFVMSLCVQASLVTDPDIWWHLRTGQWILAHGTVTATDPFSTYGQGKSWIAYSWLFEVILYGLYKLFGLLGPIIYTTGLALAITLALLSLIHKLTRKAAPSVLLTALAMLAWMPLLTPRPWLFTILFFILELDLLLTAKRSGKLRLLGWLPLIFALWANLHLQFIYGFIPLVLWVGEPWIEQILRGQFSFKNLTAQFDRRPWLLALACFSATLATPYHLRLYIPIFEIIRQTGAYQYVSELQAPTFRDPTHWLVLGFTLSATFVLGWRREVKAFPLLLLLFGVFCAFRSIRDIWVVVIAAVLIIASARSLATTDDRFVVTKLQVPLMAAIIGLMLFAIIQRRQLSEARLQNELAKTFPVAAVKLIEERGYPGPLYNHFNWGGYLIWRLPQLPVCMDGRSNLHGDERIERFVKTWGGAANWMDDKELAAARLVIADVNMPLASLLSCDSRFELVYRDAVAVVFTARKAVGTTQ